MKVRKRPRRGARRGRSSLPGRGGARSSSAGGSRKASVAGGAGGARELGRGDAGCAACPLVCETPPTPSALLKTREKWRSASFGVHLP